MPSSRNPDAVAYRVTETRHPPALSLLFGFGAMVPFVLGAAGAWLLAEWRPAVVTLTALWGCAILCFLSGVRRGVSFRTPGGATAAQLLTMLWLFVLGFGALIAFAAGATVAGLGLLLLGYGSMAVLDPIAARRGEAPLFFAELRPVQMAIPVLCLAALIALSLR